jgi:hypothetical protein
VTVTVTLKRIGFFCFPIKHSTHTERSKEEGGGGRERERQTALLGTTVKRRREIEKERALLGTMIHNGGSRAAPAHGLRITRRLLLHPVGGV